MESLIFGWLLLARVKSYLIQQHPAVCVALKSLIPKQWHSGLLCQNSSLKTGASWLCVWTKHVSGSQSKIIVSFVCKPSAGVQSVHPAAFLPIASIAALLLSSLPQTDVKYARDHGFYSDICNGNNLFFLIAYLKWSVLILRCTI